MYRNNTTYDECILQYCCHRHVKHAHIHYVINTVKSYTYYITNRVVSGSIQYPIVCDHILQYTTSSINEIWLHLLSYIYISLVMCERFKSWMRWESLDFRRDSVSHRQPASAVNPSRYRPCCRPLISRTIPRREVRDTFVWPRPNRRRSRSSWRDRRTADCPVDWDAWPRG